MWYQVINIVLGLWLMAMPGIFDFEGIVADNSHIVGPVIITFSVIALWEATFVVRKWNLPLGAWLLISPWVLGYEEGLAIWNTCLAGVVVLLIASRSAKITTTYGGGWASLWSKGPHHMENARQKE